LVVAALDHVAIVTRVPILTEVLAKYAEQGNEGLLPAAEEIVHHGHLAEYLYGVTGDGHETDDNFPVGYRHPNGFTKIRLARLADSGWIIRLHIWEPDAVDGDIHNHRWHFASYVVNGSIAEQRYEVTNSDGPWTMHDCSPSLDGEYVLANARPCDVRLVAEDKYQCGDSYQRPADALHVAKTAGHRTAVTLFIQGPDATKMTTVLRAPGTLSVSRRMLPMCSSAELKHELRDVLKLISNA
jgi:hypothetical protein